MKKMNSKTFINIKELSIFLEVSPNTIYYWIQLKKIPYYKFGKNLRFATDDINAWIEKKRVGVKMFNFLFTVSPKEGMIDDDILTVVRNLNERRL